MFGMKKKTTSQEMVPVANTPSTKPKTSLIEELKSLDFQEYGEWAPRVRMVTWVGITLLVTAIGSFIFVKPQIDQANSYKAERPMLLEELRKKEVSLKEVQSYEAQLEQMEARFNQQLQQLPKESEIPELVQDVSDAAKASGFDIVNVSLDLEQIKEIFKEQPIKVHAEGGYHSFGRFAEQISTLPRIVKINGFVIETDPSKRTAHNLIPTVKYDISASTYSYLEPVAVVSTPPEGVDPATMTTEEVSQ